MSKYEIYGIYDEATQAYVQSLPCINEKVAQMTFETLFKQRRFNIPMIYDYPNLFSAYKLAIFDDNKGTYENLSQPELFMTFGSIQEDKEKEVALSS